MPDDGAEERLAVYGTLAPGRANHHVLAALGGLWRAGHVRGRLLQAGWGAAQGAPGLRPDDAAEEIPVHLLESGALPAYWARLDAFEGAEYTRQRITVRIGAEHAIAYIYTLTPSAAEEGERA